MNAAEIEYVPAGYTTPSAGYFLTEQAGRDILEGWSTDRAAKEAYKAALDDMYAEWQGFKASMEQQIADVRDSLTAEREAHAAALRKAKRPGLGVALTLGYTTDQKLRLSLGFGYVWRIY